LRVSVVEAQTGWAVQVLDAAERRGPNRNLARASQDRADRRGWPVAIRTVCGNCVQAVTRNALLVAILL